MLSAPNVLRLWQRVVLKLSDTDIGLSITGIAGPDGGSKEKPVGLVYIGMATQEQYETIKLNLSSQLARESIRQRSASAAINKVRLFLLDS